MLIRRPAIGPLKGARTPTITGLSAAAERVLKEERYAARQKLCASRL
jgi:hypothetical protein